MSSRLSLVGPASPRKPGAVRAGFGDAKGRLPAAYVDLMATWGPGDLCGFIELPDPTERRGRHHALQSALTERFEVARSRGLWLTLGERELAKAAVLGIDRRSWVLIALEPSELRFLEPTGRVEKVGTFETLVDDYLLRDGLSYAILRGDGKYSSLSSELHQTVPAIYATTPAQSLEVITALTRGDQAAADAALAKLGAREVLPFAWLALIDRIAGPDGNAIAAELRNDAVVELYTQANRRMPRIAEQLPLRELRRAATSGGMSDELRARWQKIANVVTSTFFDEAATIVASDELPNAAARGLVVPAGFDLDVDAWLGKHTEAWQTQDPNTSLEPVLAHIPQLHPTQRTGYTLLLNRLGWNAQNHPATRSLGSAEKHLSREAPDAWAHLVLALRSTHPDENVPALELLHAARLPHTLPYLRSVVEHPPPFLPDRWTAEEVYADLAALDDAATKQLFFRFIDPARKRAAHARQRAAAFKALERFAAEDHIFLAYLESFGSALPYSERAIALADRWTDPRVIPALRSALLREERFCEAGNSRSDVDYSDTYATIARRLIKLGDTDAKAALAKYKRASRRSPL